MSIHETLSTVQKSLNAPKGQHNSFGNYWYRSCEDIQGAVKPLLPSGVTIVVSDDIVLIGDRVYVKATATITNGAESVSATAYAREASSKKGMDDAQVTGSTSSYARKYALNGLLLIDDAKDADALHDHGEHAAAPKPQRDQQRSANDSGADAETIARMNAAASVPDLVKVMNALNADEKRAAKSHFDGRMKELKRAA